MVADERPEELINYYAQARVGVRTIANAVGFFALLWSTVVLLGGFVSVLTNKDFWFLSVLSLVMASKTLELATNAAGIYVSAEKHILRLSKGPYQLEEANRYDYWITVFHLSAVIAVKRIIGMLITSIFLVSTHVCIALSVVRLVQRDYGDAGGDAVNKAKLKAALIIFYVLVIFHGLCVFYWSFINTFEPWMLVSKEIGFGVWGPKIVRRYRDKTRAVCFKDGVLPNNWNLITFSVGLLESASPDDRLWGARVLDTFSSKGISIRQELLSSSQAIQNLINMILGSTRTDDPAEIKERAARIVAAIGSELRITQFPDALRCICCLLESCNPYSDPEIAHPSQNSKQILDKTACKVSEHSHHQEDAHLSLAITEQTDHKQVVNLASGKAHKIRSWIQTLRIRSKTKSFKEVREWEIYFGDKYHYSYVSKGTKELISQGLVILEKLTRDKDSCIEIIKHQRLVSKITSPLSCHDLLNNACDHTWVEILGRSLTVVSRLICAGPADDTTRLRHDMSRNAVAIRNLLSILEVDSEGVRELHEQAIEILAVLAFHDSFRKLAFDESTSMTEMFAKTLQRIFLEDWDGNGIVAKEGEEKDNRVRRKAGEALAILLHVPSARDLALTSTTNVNAVDPLPKQDVINLLTMVVDQILSSKARKVTDVAMRASASKSSPVESQPPNGADTRQSPTRENEEQPEDDRKMFAAMLSLTAAICNKNVISGDEFTRAVPDEAALMKKLKEIVETNTVATTAGGRILKLVCQVVIAMVQLKPYCLREFNEHSFKEALSKALETMSDVDNCMLFAGDDREVPARSLVSLVKEAQELLAQELGDIIST